MQGFIAEQSLMMSRFACVVTQAQEGATTLITTAFVISRGAYVTETTCELTCENILGCGGKERAGIE